MNGLERKKKTVISCHCSLIYRLLSSVDSNLCRFKFNLKNTGVLFCLLLSLKFWIPQMISSLLEMEKASLNKWI